MEADLSKIGAMADWELSHIFEHQRILNRTARNGKVIPNYPLDFSFTPSWLRIHEDEHKALRLMYGVPATRDFSALDPKNKQELDGWLSDHYLEHQQIASKV